MMSNAERDKTKLLMMLMNMVDLHNEDDAGDGDEVDVGGSTEEDGEVMGKVVPGEGGEADVEVGGSEASILLLKLLLLVGELESEGEGSCGVEVGEGGVIELDGAVNKVEDEGEEVGEEGGGGGGGGRAGVLVSVPEVPGVHTGGGAFASLESNNTYVSTAFSQHPSTVAPPAIQMAEEHATAPVPWRGTGRSGAREYLLSALRISTSDQARPSPSPASTTIEFLHVTVVEPPLGLGKSGPVCHLPVAKSYMSTSGSTPVKTFSPVESRPPMTYSLSFRIAVWK